MTGNTLQGVQQDAHMSILFLAGKRDETGKVLKMPKMFIDLANIFENGGRPRVADADLTTDSSDLRIKWNLECRECDELKQSDSDLTS